MYGPNSTWLDSTRLDMFDFVERVETNVSSVTSVSSRTFSKMAEDKEAVVLACTSLVFCALSVHANKTESKTTRCVCERLSEKRDFWMLRFSSDVRFNEITKRSGQITGASTSSCLRNFLIMHDIIYYYLLFQITN